MTDDSSKDASAAKDAAAGRGLTRRHVLLLAGGATAGGLLSACSQDSTAGTSPFPPTTATAGLVDGGVTGTLPVPPLLAPELAGTTKVFSLTLQQGRSHFIPGATTTTFGANGAYLAPTLRATSGDPVLIHVTNQLGETTTIHWHGMHLPAAMDGGPMQTIDDGTTWSPGFTVNQAAATLWYHPHMMEQTLRQVGMGLVGMFIVDDDDAAQQALPRDYGVDDLPLILQAQTFDTSGQLVLDGGDGGRGRDDDDGGGGRSTTLVNGAISPEVTAQTSRMRLRLLNASSRAIYDLGFAGGETFEQVASDGGLLPAPVELSRLRLAPAERVEIVVDVPDGAPLVLQSLGGNDGGRGRDNDAPGGDLLTIHPPSSGSVSGTPLPATLGVIERLEPAAATTTRDFVLGGDDRDPTINGRSMTSMSDLMDMSDVIEVGVDTVEIWNLVNESNDTHAFHVHDVQFQILSRDGADPSAGESGRKDTVVVSPDETVSIIMRFADYADPDSPYMYHCHLLNHEDDGMMGQFVVV